MLGLPLSKWWHGIERGNAENRSAGLHLVVLGLLVLDYMFITKSRIKLESLD